jgi:hypothetical protein
VENAFRNNFGETPIPRGIRLPIQLIDLLLSALFLAAVTHLFLARLNLGVIVLFLLPPFKDLSAHEAGVLGWYVVVYFVFVFGVFPPVLFIRPLIDHHHHRKTYFSSFTCWLGIFAWFLVGPATVFLVLPLLFKGA